MAVSSTKVGIITQARTNNTRLPKKVLRNVAGLTLLEHHLNRLSSSGYPVIVATTTNPDDVLIVELCDKIGVPYFRGSEEDVLERYKDCAKFFKLDAIVRVCSDSPLIDGQMIRDGITTFLQIGDPWCYLSNSEQRTFPVGFDFEIFSMEQLEIAERETRGIGEPLFREHVTPYMRRNISGKTKPFRIVHDEDMSHLRVTVDTEEDLRLVKQLLEVHSAHSLGVLDIINLLNKHPELIRLNAGIRQIEVDSSSQSLCQGSASSIWKAISEFKQRTSI